MLLQPRMVRRTLHGEIERNFQAVSASGVQHLLEIIEIAQFRMHGVVAAFLAADGVRAAHIAG